jgi:S1-C subfamily serine protease
MCWMCWMWSMWLACAPTDGVCEDRLAEAEAQIASLQAQVAGQAPASPREERMRRLEELRAERAQEAADRDGEDGASEEDIAPAGPQCSQGEDGVFILPSESLAELSLQDTSYGRMLLHRGPDGQYDGYRLSAIRRGNLLDSCGFKNGDVVHSVNDQTVDSMDAAMTAYNTVRNLSPLTVRLTRRGESIDLILRSPAP